MAGVLINGQFASEEQLNKASAQLEADWVRRLADAGQTPEQAQTEAATTFGKIEAGIALRLQSISAQEGIEPSAKKLRVIVYYKPRTEFDALLDEIGTVVRGRRSGSAAPRGEAVAGEGLEGLELTDEEFGEVFSIVENTADLAAEGLLREINRASEVDTHLRLVNAVVARLDGEQIREIARREDVERIEIDKPMFTELKQSVPLMRVAEARTQGLLAEGRGVVVAVLDGEVSAEHPDLKDRVVQKRNYTQEGWGQPNKHGTHVGGIIAGAGSEYRGVAPQATLWSYKLFPTGNAESSESTVNLEVAEGSTGADAIEDAVKDGASVINCSWGIGGTDLKGNSVWALAAERATKLGVVVVKSAGNAGPDTGTLTTPADARGEVIVVGAISRDGTEVTNFSSRGPTGDDRVKPDVCAPGEGIVSTSEAGRGYRTLSGTSMASPHVAGLAALLLERNPKWKPADVRRAVLDGADPRTSGDTAPNTQGKGLVNAVRAAGGTTAADQADTNVPKDSSEAVSCTKAVAALQNELAAVRRDVAYIRATVTKK